MTCLDLVSPLPVKTFGLFVAFAFLTASFILTRELKRKQTAGLLSSVKETLGIDRPVGLVSVAIDFTAGSTMGLFTLTLISICFGNTNWVNAFKSIGMLLYFRSKQHWVFLSVFGFTFSAIRYFIGRKQIAIKPITQEKEVWPHERVDIILAIAAIGGLIGAKLFDALENRNSYIAHPENFIAFSGLTFYGGLIVAAIAIMYYAHQKHMDKWHLADSAAPALMLAYGIGRIGCHMSGDGDWGIVNPFSKPVKWLPDWLWSYTYPHNGSDQGIQMLNCIGPHCFQLPQGVFPTSLYECIVCSLLFLVLWQMRKVISAPGQLFGIYLIMNGVEQFMIELIRVNNTYDLGFIKPTQAELISLVIVMVGLAIIVAGKNGRLSRKDEN